MGEYEDEAGYDHGYRQGTFDKCNGHEKREFWIKQDDPFDTSFLLGYEDGWVSNEVQI